MKVLVPHVEHPRELQHLLEEEGINARYVSTHEPEGYWRCLAEAWEEGTSFIVLEGDKYPAPGALLELWECPGWWCTYPVPMRESEEPAPYPSLACTKFAWQLMTAAPLLMQHAGELDVGLGEREWSRLDLVVQGLLHNITEPHYHEAGRVEHRHR